MFALINLPYSYDSLAPYISKQTLEFHHDKHLAGYVNKLNELLAPHEFFMNYTLEELLQNLEKLPEDIRIAVTNNAGQVYNHNLYFEALQGGKNEFKLSKELGAAVDGFGSYENFQKLWTAAGIGQFGSGWVWLVVDVAGKLSIEKTSNADSPIMHGKTPILTMDVWEHAYYLDYQNRRPDYIKDFFEMIDWDMVSNRYAQALANQ
jgi:superoxide dismutase, Fe-Mn family